jgi:DNA polymerase III delta prime subunit
LVLHDDQKEFMNRCLAKGDIPHLALFGPPGSGKTTLARILVDSLIQNDMDVLMMNGSDSTGVENMRTTVLGFLKSPPYQSKFKIVYIDEFDYTTSNAQAVLRNMMETYAENGRFVVTGNYWSKVMEPIQSRFTLYEMATIPKDFIMKYVTNILDTEKIKYDINSVELIVQSLLPDVRKIVNTLQKNVIDGKLKKIDATTIISNEKKIAAQLIQIAEDMGNSSEKATINRNVPQIMELLNDGNEPDYIHIYQTLFHHETLPAWAKIKVNQFMNNHRSCVNPSVHFMAMVYDIVQAGMTFFNMFGNKK